MAVRGAVAKGTVVLPYPAPWPCPVIIPPIRAQLSGAREHRGLFLGLSRSWVAASRHKERHQRMGAEAGIARARGRLSLGCNRLVR